MKKFAKVLGVLALSTTLCVGAAAFAGCTPAEEEAKETTHTGEYHYVNAWGGNDYGVRVKVTVKGDTISKVEIVENEDYVVVTSTWGDRAKWDTGIEGLLKAYEGKKVADVKAATGSIEKVDGATENKISDSSVLITGATQGSVRLLKAVQNALNDEHKGEAYGLVHSAGYAGYASVTVKAGAITDVQLSEVCLPTYITIPNDDTTIGADYKVTATVKDHGKDVEKTFYKTVTYAKVTMTYDATAKTYMVGDKTMLEYFQDAKNVKTYYDSVMNNNVTVVVGEDNAGKKKDVMTKAALSKEENGYWGTPAEGQLGWKANRDAVVKYVKEHGVDELLKLELKDLNNDKYWVDSNNVSTGATWTDMNTKKDNTVSYSQLIKNAWDAKY